MGKLLRGIVQPTVMAKRKNGNGVDMRLLHLLCKGFRVKFLSNVFNPLAGVKIQMHLAAR